MTTRPPGGIGDGRALIATVDVFTPIVDDAYDWGRIAATNAFSDVYAMGGTPVMALNVAGWPVDDLPLDLLARVLQGGQEVAADAGAVVVGGHTITATPSRSTAWSRSGSPTPTGWCATPTAAAGDAAVPDQADRHRA